MRSVLVFINIGQSKRTVPGGGPLPVCIHIEHFKLAPVPFAQRATIVEAFRADARVLRSWLGLPAV